MDISIVGSDQAKKFFRYARYLTTKRAHGIGKFFDLWAYYQKVHIDFSQLGKRFIESLQRFPAGRVP